MQEILNKTEKVAISPKAQILLNKIVDENDFLRSILETSTNETDFINFFKHFIYSSIKKHKNVEKFLTEDKDKRKLFELLTPKETAIIRFKDYLDNEKRTFADPNLNNRKLVSSPFRNLWLAYKYGRGGASEYYFEDMLELFRQLKSEENFPKPSRENLEEWMNRHPSGLEPEIIEVRRRNRERIINLIIKKIDSCEIHNAKYDFDEDMKYEEKYNLVSNVWWNDRWFHLRFAIRNPILLNEMLDNSLDDETMNLLCKAQDKGIPFFVNPYYLTLLNVSNTNSYIGSDLAIRDYVIYSRDLVNEYGNISAWEKEDIIEKGKPNAAGWIMPSNTNIHRRYPEVAILIPDTIGRACAGLCSSCQRMYDFQRGHLSFNFDKLKPKETWEQKLYRLMNYYEHDSQLRDILITGGDALMSQDVSLTRILNAVYEMALRKKEANCVRTEKYAEIIRVRLGTRLPVYLPQRIDDNLMKILKEFRDKASEIGIKQFIIQTHFETAMEITPESVSALKNLISAGWLVTNQIVLTASASRRGHTAKLRKVLNDVGVLSYYTFTVKGYRENRHNFATNARIVQEQMEEKYYGKVPDKQIENLINLTKEPTKITENINKIRQSESIPFVATDRSVLNLPGVGKSLTFRVIGITRSGRRILEFDHDSTRWHSPVIDDLGKLIIIEPKSIREYLNQLREMGEDEDEYNSIWLYGMGETEPRMPIFEYPEYEYDVTACLTNLYLASEPV